MSCSPVFRPLFISGGVIVLLLFGGPQIKASAFCKPVETAKRTREYVYAFGRTAVYVVGLEGCVYVSCNVTEREIVL